MKGGNVGEKIDGYFLRSTRVEVVSILTVFQGSNRKRFSVLVY